MLQEQEEILRACNDAFRPHTYFKVFHLPSSGADWKVDAAFLDGFFESATLLLQRVISGEMLESRGIAAVFLCRHYLELAIKYALFHSRWLKDDNTNANDADVMSVKTTHNLQELWDTFRKELKDRLPEVLKVGYDLDFVGKFVAEFHNVDSGNWRFRYPTKQLAIATAGEIQMNTDALGIDFETLLFDLQHVEQVLRDLDARLVNTYGLNEEWQSELKGM